MKKAYSVSHYHGSHVTIASLMAALGVMISGCEQIQIQLQPEPLKSECTFVKVEGQEMGIFVYECSRKNSVEYEHTLTREKPEIEVYGILFRWDIETGKVIATRGEERFEYPEGEESYYINIHQDGKLVSGKCNPIFEAIMYDSRGREIRLVD